MKNVHYLNQFTSRKKKDGQFAPTELPDNLHTWMENYLQMAIAGVRSEEVARKIALHLECFIVFFTDRYGHDRISACLKRDVLTWRDKLQEDDFAPASINNHLASLSGFTSWVQAQAPDVFPAGNPTRGVGELGLAPLEPRALNDAQVRLLKNLCDRLERFHQLKGRRWNGKNPPLKAKGRPWRDRAIVFTLLSPGLEGKNLYGLI